MNIKQLGKLFNENNKQEVRTLELKVGQVVRGVVTQQLPNQEALVNINGVQVRAKLEVPILEGQATLMQVAPDSKGSFIHLRQVDPATMGLQDPMKDILRAMQLPDREWSNQLVRELRQEGFALNRETLQALAQAAKAVPPNVDLEGWMQAAILAFKRGMPMTPASISAMHQISQNGLSLHQLVNVLQGQLSNLLQAQGQQFTGSSGQLLQALSQQLNQLIQGQVVISTQSQSQMPNQALSQSQTEVQQQATSQATHQALTSQGQSLAATTHQNPIMSFMKMLGVQHESLISQQIVNKGELLASSNPNNHMKPATNTVNQHTVASNQTQQGQIANSPIQQAPVHVQAQVQVGGQLSQLIQPSQQSTNNAQSQPLQQAQVTSLSQGQSATQININQTNQATPINTQQTIPTQLLTTQVGGESTNQSSPLAQSAGVPSQAVASGNTMLAAQTSVSNQAEFNVNQVQAQLSNTTTNQATDSLKATVLNALQLTDLPTTVKETMNQLLNHITGQQMLLAAERNHSMFTHITMYIPIKDEHGGQTAAIHVQTRRDRKGQLDAENCRIVFDLNMKQLGQTLVDMNVTKKIVSLNIWNDSTIIQPLFEAMRPEIFESLQKTGYSLSSIKVTPFQQEEQVLNEAKAIVQPPDIQHINAARYKGVDLKI